MKKYLNLSVHDLVDFLLRSGDIDNRVFNSDTMRRGSEIHSSYQKYRTKNYSSEYYLKTSLEVDDYIVNIEGRADGIYFDDIPTIEEIKSTVDDLEKFYKENKGWHLGQAIVYAYMYLKQTNLEKCNISLVYISQVNDEEKTYKFSYDYEKLEEKVINFIKEYLKFYEIIYNHKVKRNKTAEDLKFPFKNIRKGQDKFIKLATEISSSGGVAFIEAPTGIGKTISSLYPFVKSFKDETNDKIFYLTAKNTGKESAYLASKIMIEKGLDSYSIYITAKEKICAHLGSSCNPDECPFAKGYYSKLKDAIIESLKTRKLFNEETIKKIANKYAICPFEFSLDLSNFMDIVIADYNYFFDPIVYLERYFSINSSNYLVLVDEAHNLLERARDMYSETISLSLLIETINDYRYATKNLKRAFSRLKKIFINILEVQQENNSLIEDVDHEMYLAINNLNNNLKDYLKENKFHPNEYSIDFSRRLNRFLKLYEIFDDCDRLFISKTSDDVAINIYCLDPSKRIRESIDLVKGALFFSATLSPIDYYKNVLGGEESDPHLLLPSPFPKENFKLIISPISIKYKNRDLTLPKVIDLIKSFTENKKGNYLIYSPSFEYLEKLKAHFISDSKEEYLFQNRDMSDYEKRQFINRFLNKSNKSIIGFSVVGGAFAEGIDLVADSLIGVVVIGVGLPTINFKTDLIKDYYSNKELNGYSYAYKHPGMNKINQAVGRLIRSESDIGACMLIDDRYLTNEYRKLFKKDWSDYEVANSSKDVEEILNNFWHKK